MDAFSFDLLPEAVANLSNDIREMKALLLQKAEPQPEPNNPIGIKEVAKLTGLTVPTLYGYCQRNEIPYNKKGNRLYFFKSSIIDWIKTGKQKTLKELEADADAYLSNINKGLSNGN